MAGTLSITGPTVGASGSEEPAYLIPQELPANTDVLDAAPPEKYRTSSTVPADVAQRLLSLTLARPDLRVAGTEWRENGEQLYLYSAAPEALVATALREAGLDDSVEYRASAMDAEQKAAFGQELAAQNGLLSSGHRVVSVAPSLDGTEVTVTLDESVKGEGSVAFPQLRGVAQPRIHVEFGPAAEATRRNHLPTPGNPVRYGGAFMQRLELTTGGCSTGFRMTQISGSVPAMGSAHHCFKGVEGQAWKYSTMMTSPGPYLLGSASSPYGPGLSAGDVGVWKGGSGGVDYMAPGIFVGDNSVGGSNVYAIKGAVGNTVGAYVCYSGSYSGTVCNNQIQQTGMTVCYNDPDLPCYSNLVLTSQVGGIPAVGQGDSGGPAYATNNGLYAAGIISGIANANNTCTGDQGRLCSTRAWYAPITEMMTAGYGLNYVP